MSNRTKMIRKTGFTMIAASMMASIALSGCAKDNKTAESPSPSAAATAQATKAPELKPVELSWYYLAWSDPKDIAAVNEKVNEITKKKINATVKLNPLTWDNFIQKTNVMAAAGDTYDLVFTSNWINPFDQAISKGSLRKLDDLWQYMPTVKKGIPEKIWNATAVKGSNFGVVNKQILANQYGPGVHEDYVKQYNVDLKKLTNFESVLPIYEQIKKDNKDVLLKPLDFNTIGFAPAFYGNFEAVGDTKVPGWIDTSNNDLKVINQYETPEIKKVAQFNADIVKKGYVDQRMKLPGQDFKVEEKANKFPVVYAELLKPDVLKNGKVNTDGKTKTIFNQVTKPKIFTSSLTATLTGISATSKNPERAAMLIELVHTDKELYNLLCFGIEGKHYTKVGDNVIKKITDSGYDPGTDWMFGNQFNAYYTDPANVGTWEATEKLNAESEYSKLLGFNFNAEPVKTEIAAVNSVLTEYGSAFAGFFPEKYDEFLTKMKNAGAEKIIAEKQKQIDEWKKTQK